MAKILRSSKAEEDLLEIWSHIADNNPEAADNLLRGIDAACKTLAENPSAGRAREELTPRLRSFVVGNYLIFYRPTENGIIVIRVLHGSRDLPELL
jgi:toxin ParE1/3/4